MSIRPEDPENATPRKLLDAARDAAMHAYAPYSGYCVGAAAETADGRIFVGTNMENASYGLTVCAEIGALQSALSAGALDKVRRLAIVGGQIHGSPTDAPETTPPCGRCRQLIAEAASMGKHDIEVWFADLYVRQVEMQPISALLPHPFSTSHLTEMNDTEQEPFT